MTAKFKVGDIVMTRYTKAKYMVMVVHPHIEGTYYDLLGKYSKTEAAFGISHTYLFIGEGSLTAVSDDSEV